MASIRKRTKKDGSFSYTAYIRIKQSGEVVYTDSRTFSKEANAKSWAKKEEGRLDNADVLKEAIKEKQHGHKKVTFRELINLYIIKARPLKPWGTTKQNTLEMLQRYPIAELVAERMTAKDIVDHIVMRSAETSPTTANGDYMYIRQVLSVAEDLLGCPIKFEEVDKAQRTLKKIGAISKSTQRERRPTVEEITDIVELCRKKQRSKYWRDSYAPLDKIVLFAMFSSRRLSEICRITREDTNFERQEVMVRDMKHPGQKQGNDVWCYVPDEAWEIMLSMPESEDGRWFPFEPKSIGDTYRRTRKEAGHHQFFEGGEDDSSNPNLRFHDLRHECASWLFEKNGLPGENWDVPRVALVTGHKDWNSLKRYTNMRQVKPFNKWANSNF